MSLAIDIDEVVKVNISGTWHDVAYYGEDDEANSSFFLDSYEFISNPGFDQNLEHGGGQGGICATGFSFIDADTNLRISGPLTSITAVMTAGSNANISRAMPLQNIHVQYKG